MAHEPELTAAQNERLAVLLRNESDVAYTRRATRIMAYLELKPGMTVFDCGTGRGFYLKLVDEICPGCRLVGLDYDEHVLAFARSHLQSRGALLNRGDIHHLPYQAETFDAVILSEVLEHLADDAGALQEIKRIMKPGAVLAVTVPHQHYSGWFDPLNRILEGIFHKPIRRGPFAGIWANHVRLYLPADLNRLINAAGFRVERIEEQTHYCFPGTQFIVYTIGKGLIEHNLLPAFMARSTHRFQGEANRGSALNPINWVLQLFRAVDRLNDNTKRMAHAHTFVNIALKARKV
ncbi:MAG: class I SAM-dependent methyltransferase [Anaerolineae bacterium]